MDVSDPALALASGLTMPVLRALAQRSSPATAAQLYRTTHVGTEAGVRRALERMTIHGVVVGTQGGDRTLYSLNYDHVLHSAVSALLRARDELPRRLRKQFADWSIQPIAAALYGSAARGDGDVDSDIDLLVIRPAMLASQSRETWATQVHQLRDLVRRWTGNPCQVTDRSLISLRKLARGGESIVQAWLNDSIAVAGATIDELLG